MTLCVTFDENKSFFQDKVHGLRRLYAIQEKKCEPACNTFVFMICILSGHTLPPMSGDLPQLVTPPEEWKGYFLYF